MALTVINDFISTHNNIVMNMRNPEPKLKLSMRTMFFSLFSAEFRIPVIGTAIGFMVGVLIVLADHYLTAKPSLEVIL